MTEKEMMVDGKNGTIKVLIMDTLAQKYALSPYCNLEENETLGDVKNSHKLFENVFHRNDILKFFMRINKNPTFFTAKELLIYYKFNQEFKSIVDSNCFKDDIKVVDLATKLMRENPIIMRLGLINGADEKKADAMIAEGKDYWDVYEKLNNEYLDKKWSSENISEKIKDAKNKDYTIDFYILKIIQKSSERMFEEGSKKVTTKGKKTPKILPLTREDEEDR